MRIKNGINIIFFVFLLVGTIIIIRKHQPEASYYTAEGFTYGTSYRITYKHTERLDSALIYTMKKVDASLSMFNKLSTVSQINAGQTCKTDSLLTSTLNLAFMVNKKTSGAFDVTVAPLVNFWGFGTERRKNIKETDVDSILSYIGMDKIALVGDSLTKQDARTMLDFSAIAKGLGVDLVAEYLETQGIENYFVEIGGEIVCKGVNSNGKAWTIGISQPSENSHEIIASKVECKGRMAIATSGNYNNYYIKDGKRFAHTINPHTGFPAEKDILSATVIAPSCAIADAYATAFMVMGLEDAEKVLQADTTLAAYFICDSVSVASEKFKHFLLKK